MFFKLMEERIASIPPSSPPIYYAVHRIMQSIFSPAARRKILRGKHEAGRRAGGLKMDWTKPLHCV